MAEAGPSGRTRRLVDRCNSTEVRPRDAPGLLVQKVARSIECGPGAIRTRPWDESRNKPGYSASGLGLPPSPLVPTISQPGKRRTSSGPRILEILPRFASLTTATRSVEPCAEWSEAPPRPGWGNSCNPWGLQFFIKVFGPGSTTRSVWPALTPSRTVFSPEGQVMTTLSAFSAAPRPKVKGCSTEER